MSIRKIVYDIIIYKVIKELLFGDTIFSIPRNNINISEMEKKYSNKNST